MKGIKMSLLVKKAGVMGFVGMVLSWLIVGIVFVIFLAVCLFQEKMKGKEEKDE